jgi:SsrA-binding protein
MQKTKEYTGKGRTIAQNKKARHDYHLEETFEAGIVLVGSEVKSLREGKVHLKDSYAQVEGGEVWLYQCHISPYTQANRQNHDPLRPRKLLLHAQEIRRLIGKTKEKGLTLIPLSIYIKGRRFKVELALGRGKKLYDKREDIKKREQTREIEKAMKSRG